MATARDKACASRHCRKVGDRSEEKETRETPQKRKDRGRGASGNRRTSLELWDSDGRLPCSDIVINNLPEMGQFFS